MQFNTSLPLRVMLMCWGPYVLMCIYACFENVKVVSPKLRMVSNNSVQVPPNVAFVVTTIGVPISQGQRASYCLTDLLSERSTAIILIKKQMK